MDNAIEEKQVGDLTVRLFYDEGGENPREWDNLGTLLLFHRRRTLGDENDMTLPDSMKFVNRPEQISFPVFCYEHGGTALSTRSFIGRAHHAEWDSGMLGWITVSKERLCKEFNWKKVGKKRREDVYRWLSSEVDVYSAWLNGECYRWEIFDTDNAGMASTGGYIGHCSIADALRDGEETAKEILERRAQDNGVK